jgi:hypothetical protein
VVISIGDHKTRKRDVLECMLRQDLTAQAMKDIDKRRQNEREHNEELEQGVDPVETSVIPVIKSEDDVGA